MIVRKTSGLCFLGKMFIKLRQLNILLKIPSFTVNLYFNLSLSLRSVSVQFSCSVWLFASQTKRTAARQASLSITNSQTWLKLMSIELVMPSNHLTLRCPLLLLLHSFPASGSSRMSQFFHQVAKVLECQHQHQSFQWIFRADFF